jgi:hypothetical protein
LFLALAEFVLNPPLLSAAESAAPARWHSRSARRPPYARSPPTHDEVQPWSIQSPPATSLWPKALLDGRPLLDVPWLVHDWLPTITDRARNLLTGLHPLVKQVRLGIDEGNQEWRQ